MIPTLRRRPVDAATATADDLACDAIREAVEDDLGAGRGVVRARTVIGAALQVVTVNVRGTHAVAMICTDGWRPTRVVVVMDGYSLPEAAQVHADTVRLHTRRPRRAHRVIA